MQFKNHLLVVLTLLFSFFTHAQNTSPSTLKQYIANLPYMDGMKHASIGVCVMDAATGSVIAQHDMNRSLLTASTMKLVTTATALGILGQEYRYKTILEYEGEIKDGVLYGNLYIKGAGDPSLGSDRFGAGNSANNVLTAWVNEIKKAGIKRIEGKIMGDATCFSAQNVPDHWVWQDLGNYYGAGPTGLCLNENLYKIHLKTGKKEGDPVTLLSWDESVRGLKFINELQTGAAGSGDNSYIYGAPFSYLRYIRGTLPPNESDFVIKGSIPDPEKYCAEMLCDKLAELNVPTAKGFGGVLADLENGISPQTNRKPIYTHLSPPLKDIAYWTNLKSVNLFAECLLSTIAKEKTGLGDTKKGLEIMWKYWEEKGVPAEGMLFQDGSGLSPNNALTALQMTSILRKVRAEAYFSPFFNSLPVAGESGTLSTMCKDTPAEGRVHAKSGYMSRVRSYAGYVTTLSGKQLCFTVLANNYTDSPAKMKERLEMLFIKMAEYP